MQTVVDNTFLFQSYDTFASVEDEFNAALDDSLDPRGPEMLFDAVAELGLPPDGFALDVGCGEGGHSIELAKRFGLRVVGVDPVARHIDIGRRELAMETRTHPSLESKVRFQLGFAEDLPVPSASVDLVWCRDVLVHVDDLDRAYAEIGRVLKPHGRALVYQMFGTERLEPNEAAWLFPTMGCVAANMQPNYAEAAMHRANLGIEGCAVLGTEWGEYGQERSGRGGRKLLHAARLLREPQRYIERFGPENYAIALGDCLWHVYRLIGKLSDRVYLLTKGEV